MSNVTIAGKTLSQTTTHLPFYDLDLGDMRELAKLTLLKDLRSASLTSSNLNDEGLFHLCQVATLENLNLQETRITDEGLRHLALLPRLRHLRLKDNPQLTNGCVPHLCALSSLVDLQVHETSIDQSGLDELVVLSGLRDLTIEVWDENFTFEGLVALSSKMPLCAILAKGQGTFLGGAFAGSRSDWRRLE